MSDPKANRFRMPLLVALAAGMALGSFWLLEVSRRAAETAAPGAVRSAPDYYVDHFTFTRMSESGQPLYRISGDKLIHYPLDDSSEITHPLLHRLDKDKPPMTIYADRARIEDDNSKIHMYGNVNVDRPATPMAKYFHLQSEYLLVLPDEDVAQTDRPVRLILDKSTLNGVGMYANNATREFRLDQRVQGTYPPRTR